MKVKLKFKDRTYGFDVKIEETRLPPDDSVINAWKRLKELKALGRAAGNSKAKQALLQSEGKELRAWLNKEVSFMKYKLAVSLGKRKLLEYDYSEKIDPEEIRNVCRELTDEVVNKRKECTQLKEETKDFLGFKYSTIGGVFNKVNSILDVANKSNPVSRIQAHKKPHPAIKDPFVGIELEFSCRASAETIQGLFIAAGLAGRVHVGSDGSIRTELDTHRHTVEVRVLCKQKEIKSVVTRVCEVLNSSAVNAFVNASCGLHIHMDMRNRDANKAYHNFIMIQPMLVKMLPQERMSSEYCRLNTTSDLDTEIKGNVRYKAFNALAMAEHRTIECRMHTGTTNATKIINWISILATAADYPTKIGQTINNSMEFAAINNNDKLLNYIEKRTELFKSSISTKEDHLKYNNFEIAI